ncbi:uncharacterized protein KY384_003002 [Bacidia gigantensis]|uniref:uncharacterized protein n=1 Tax=Bacidia gigantensis TaxID=2732470 RepID=UPI001D043C86|nr:uncharacterized protein KY384_003002 [Bacidia gigantensis]KAG8531373.1 hypothetical protein KY384_003002 [Bacidia gigantensis]
MVTSMRIDPRQLRFPNPGTEVDAMPPDYDAVTASPDNRKFGMLRPAPSSKPTAKNFSETPVLVDFGFNYDHTATWENEIPSLKRYESLILALQAPEKDTDNEYTGCLRILGWFIDESRSGFGFIYEIPRPSPYSSFRPHAAKTWTLLSFLQHSGSTDSENTPSLEDRYRLALNLVTNLLHTHAKGITHRQINSNNVIFIQNSETSADSKPWKEGVIRKPYLVSWDQCDEDAATPADDMHVPRLYRHPASVLGKRSSFKPAFDVYSLGLVLLEIGLWLPLHKLFKSKYTMPKFRTKLQSTYAHKLAGKCGTMYMKIVEYCLHAADMEPSTTPQRLSQNSERAKRQEDFYWKALKPLETCCRIDESSDPIVHPYPSMVGKNGPVETSVEQASSTSTAAPVKQPEERLEADSPLDSGLTYDVLVWSYEMPSHVSTYYRNVMLPKLNKMLARAIDRWEGYTIMTFMAGDSPQTAKPTIYISCLSVTRAWKILEYVNKERKYFDIKVSVGQTCYSKASKKKARRPKRLNLTRALQENDLTEPFNPGKYHRKPSCGASISAFVDEQHLERATFGGIILADGEPFGMSVHHMLEDTDVDQGLNYETQSTSSSVSNMKWERTVYPQDDDFDPSILDQDFGDEDDELFTMGDTLGTNPGEGRDKVVTQPALDDVDPSFFPSEEDKSDEHLQSHGLGYIHASSGRKQIRHGEKKVAHEVDWALFKVCDGRLHAVNQVNGGDRYCKFDTSELANGTSPCQLLAADTLGNREVHAIGATSGLASGTILPEMVEQKMPGRVFSSTVWRFRGKFGVGGDSGAWIVDNASGALCGHVTAWNERGAYGILAPMEVMFHDMERTLGKPVALPSPESRSQQSYTMQLIAPDAIPPPIRTNTSARVASKPTNPPPPPTTENEESNYDDEAVDLRPVRTTNSAASSPDIVRSRPPPCPSPFPVLVPWT